MGGNRQNTRTQNEFTKTCLHLGGGGKGRSATGFPFHRVAYLQIKGKWVLSPEVDQRRQWEDVERARQDTQGDATQQQASIKCVVHGGDLDPKVGKDKRFAQKCKKIEAFSERYLALVRRVVVRVVRMAYACWW